MVGQDYISAWSTIMLLALNKITNVAFGFCILIMISSGYGKKVTYFSLLYLPVYLVGVFFLSRDYGADGVAFGSLVFTLFLNIAAFRFVKQKFKLNSQVFLFLPRRDLRP